MSMGKKERRDLFEANMAQVNAMQTAAGSMVKNLLLKAERNGAGYLRLSAAQGHRASYEVVEGDEARLIEVAETLGLNMGGGGIEVPSS